MDFCFWDMLFSELGRIDGGGWECEVGGWGVVMVGVIVHRSFLRIRLDDVNVEAVLSCFLRKFFFNGES